jgi:hypothetical protein
MFTKFRVLGLLLCLALFVLPLAAQANSQTGNAPALLDKIDAHLLAEIQAEGQADFFIWMVEQADVSAAYQLQTKLEKGQYVFDTLQATAETTQRELRSYLDAQGVEYRPFYVANTIAVFDGSENLLMDIAARPDVDRIVPNRQFQLDEPMIDREAPAGTAAVEPNISFIRAPDVWAMGITGQGTVMAGGDTGMQWDHPALINHYRGWDGVNADHNYNWWDATGTYPNVPGDGHGHGTHISGTMVGDDGGTNQIGVAPGAQVIHCKNMTNTGSGSDLTFTTCFEFVLAPWDLSGQNPMPSLAPDAMNNSWGYFGGGQGQFAAIIQNLHAAGILVEVSAGNEGSSCGTLRSPGDYDFVLTTGSVGHAVGTLPGTLTGFSSRGPSSLYPNAYIPTIMAPGENIRSSIPGGGYQGGWSGTSMSGPHATALVGLMWSANPGLTGMVEETMQIIIDTAVPLTGVSGSNCGGDYTTGPNNDWGFGTIDALAAVQAAMLFGGTGTLDGTVTDATTTNPLEGVEIVASLTPTMTWTAHTNADGFYSRSVFSGTYTVTASLFAYLPQTVTDVQVTEDMTTTLDFQLQPAPSYLVSGEVIDATTGWPLYASIEIQGSPYTIWTDPADGSYSVTLPAGLEYEFVVNAWVGGYNTATRTVGPLTEDATEDFGLEADLLSCTAPGYSFDYLYYENFAADDGGYTIEGPGPAPWQWGTPVTWPGECVDGPNCWGTNLTGNYNNNANESILSPVVDLSAVAPGSDLIARWHQAWHIESATWDNAYAEVSIDGGPWEIMWAHTGGTTQVNWTELSYDISDAAGGTAQFRYRFTSDGSVIFNGYYVDAVGIVAGQDCQPQAGGLVVGNVYDANTSDPLAGAQVVGDSGETATAMATPTDPNVDDAFYTIFAPAGSNVLTATIAGGYGPDTVVVNINDGETISQDFWLPAGWIEVDPAAMDVTVEFGSMATYPLTLTNLGGLSTDFALSTLLLEEHFEGDFPPDDWSVIDNGGNCVWQRNDDWPRPNFAGGDGFSAAADSDACGIGTTMNTELHTPIVDLSGATVAGLNFIASYRHLGSSSFAVDISTDGGDTWDNLLLWTADVDPSGPGFPVSLDLTPYVGSVNTVVRFHYIAPGWDWWAQVDQVQILADSGAWLSLDPATGSLAPSGGQVVVDADFDATNVPEPGQYMTAINVNQDTPYNVPPIGVTMNVIPSADMGMLEGTVNSQGYCDTNPFPVAGADVLIESASNSWNRTTDAEGYYNFFVNAAQSPLTVTVSAPAHEVGLETDVIITAQMTTTVDFDLRWLVPCISTSDDSLSATVDSGESETMTFTIFNDGGGDADFDIRERAGGYSPMAAIAGQSWTYSEAAAVGPASVRSAEGRAALAGHTPDGNIVWTGAQSLPAGDGVVRYGHAQCADNPNSFYVISGVNQAFSVTDKVWRYDADDDQWTQLASIPTGQEGISALCYEDYIYALGGGGTNQFYIYDIAANAWSAAPALPRLMWGAAVGAYDGHIYMIGGDSDFNFGGTSNLVNIYDINAGSWVGTGTVMPTAAVSAGFAQAGQYLYIVGGWGDASPGQNVNQTQRYEMGSDNWETGPTFTSARGDLALALTESHLYAIGGDANGGGAFDATNVVEKLDHTAWPGGSWEAATSLPGPLTAHKGGYCTDVVAGGEVWSVGGYTGAAVVGTTQYEPAEGCFSDDTDVPWLSQDPESGVVPADDSFDVEITFTAFPTMPLGTYTATMSVMTNDPVNGRIDVPVTMVVTGDAVYNPVIAPDTAADSGDPGEVVVYDLTVTNMGNSPDTISLSLAGNEWDTELSADSVGLLPGESIDVTVAVTIPADAMGGETDMVTVTAVSDNDANAMSTAELTTTANAIYGIDMLPYDLALSGAPGATVQYTLMVTNTGNTLDTYAIESTGYTWDVTHPDDVTLDMGEAVEVTIAVTIPADAGHGDSDTMEVKVVSSGDDDTWMSVNLTTTAVEDAWLQVAHLAPFAMDPGTAVTVTVNGMTVLTDFAYGDSTGYLPLPAGEYDVEIWPAGSNSPAIAVTIQLEGATYYSAIAIGDGDNQDLDLLLLEDDLSAPAPGTFKIRVGHLAPFAPGGATADVYADGVPILTGVEFGDVTGFLQLPAGTYDIAITAPGGDPILINPEPVTFAEGDIISAFATGDGSNQELGVFAWPPDTEGFFLPLVPDGFILYLPFVIRP